MLDDFFTRAVLAGIGIALTAGPLGCFVVWRRMAYFGDTLAHAGLPGVALALLLEVNLTAGVFVTGALIALSLVWLQRRTQVSADALLGVLSHAALATGLVLLAFMTWVRFDLMSLLLGDILAVSKTDLLMIWGGGVFVLGCTALIWRPLLAVTVNPEIAAAETNHPERVQLVFTLLLALVIAMAIKLVGALLITALLIMPATIARRYAGSPEMMAAIAAVVGVLSVIGGLYGSLQWDTPSGPSIVVAALIIFLLSLIAGRLRGAIP